MRPYPLLLLLTLLLPACRGPVRNPAALTPLPTPTAIAPPTSTILPSPTLPPTVTPVIVEYIVQAGDTLFAIALRFGTTVEAIRQANGLAEGDILNVGQLLRIPQ